MTAHRYELASDNTAGICPEAWVALEEANRQTAPSYGEDRWTQRVAELVREIFETDCEVFMVFNGTAANSLALAQLCRSFQSIIGHEQAHIEVDECGGPEFFSGGAKLLPTRGTNGKLDLAEVAATIAKQRQLHSPKPHVISVTQSTELGTVYTMDELREIADFARGRALHLHMDGARFANALATLGCAPKTITWQVGVDVLCFGGTKNGTGGGELVVFFNKELAREFDYRAKQAGQLASKMRFLSAPWAAILTDEVWLRNARRANASAASLVRKLRELGFEPVFPAEANAIFLQMREEVVAQLHARGWHFYKFLEPDICRLMCSWAVAEQTLDEFAADVRTIMGA
ncbi:MAG: beta-eliminating lyase-related protein [Verrucomicrobiota bacterium]|nr:beta-eliminating lyase-related protein [Verrucomicrobiota bacterium]